MKKFVVPLFILAILLAGCAPAAPAAPTAPDHLAPQESTKTIVDQGGGYGIFRTIDWEAGVVCWTFINYRRGGISCLPISETNLEVP